MRRKKKVIKGKNLFFQIHERIFTIIAYLVIVTPIFMRKTYNIMGGNALMNAIFLSLARIVWAISIAWIIYSCCNGWNKRLNSFLSWRYWLLISRLGLSIYLIHPILQFNMVIARKEEISFDIVNMVMIYTFSS